MSRTRLNQRLLSIGDQSWQNYARIKPGRPFGQSQQFQIWLIFYCADRRWRVTRHLPRHQGLYPSQPGGSGTGRQEGGRGGMRRKVYKHHIEILPAALLPQRGTWLSVARSLPTGACLLVTNPQNPKQAKFMLDLTRCFREKGRQVVIWPMERKGG